MAEPASLPNAQGAKDPDFQYYGMKGARCALVAFGSYTNPNRSGPSFAYVKSAQQVRKDHNLVCDLYFFIAKKNDWYFSGAKGFSANLEGSALEIGAILDRKNYQSVSAIGNSMGAYAALAYGAILGFDRVYAFNPQTRFDEAFCLEIQEKRWRTEFADMRTFTDVDHLSVQAVYGRSSAKRPDAYVYCGEQNSRDVAFARELQYLPNLTTHIEPDSGHDLVHDYRADGRLQEILLRALVSD